MASNMALSCEDKSSPNSGNPLKIIYTISLSEVSHFLDAALELLADESFHLPTKPNEICTNAAKRVMDDLKMPSESSKLFCCWVISQLISIVHPAISSNCTQVNKESLWPKLYQLQTTSSFTEQWCSYLTSLEVPAEPIFYQHFTGIIFDNLIKLNIPAVEKKDIDVNSLTFEEEIAIRYVGGYVLKSLKDVERNEEILHGINYLINNTRESNKSDSGSDVWIKEIIEEG